MFKGIPLWMGAHCLCLVFHALVCLSALFHGFGYRFNLFVIVWSMVLARLFTVCRWFWLGVFMVLSMALDWLFMVLSWVYACLFVVLSMVSDWLFIVLSMIRACFLCCLWFMLAFHCLVYTFSLAFHCSVYDLSLHFMVLSIVLALYPVG